MDQGYRGGGDAYRFGPDVFPQWDELSGVGIIQPAGTGNEDDSGHIVDYYPGGEYGYIARDPNSAQPTPGEDAL